MRQFDFSAEHMKARAFQQRIALAFVNGVLLIGGNIFLVWSWLSGSTHVTGFDYLFIELVLIAICCIFTFISLSLTLEGWWVVSESGVSKDVYIADLKRNMENKKYKEKIESKYKVITKK